MPSLPQKSRILAKALPVAKLICFISRLFQARVPKVMKTFFSQMVYSSLMSSVTIDYRSLDVSERLELVADIWDSIAEDTSAAVAPALSVEQRQELHLRLAAHQSDPSGSLPWSEVRAQLFKDHP